MSSSQSSEYTTFSNHRAFMLAAIGSAVGLGNIWRFPYIAFDSGGDVFILPYLVALLVVGTPLLLLGYATGHCYRGSPPLTFRRLGRQFKPVGWWNFLTNVIICIYYAMIVDWAANYACYFLTSAWGMDPQTFLFKDFLQMTDARDLGLDFVGKVAGPLTAIWVLTLAIMALGVQEGMVGAPVFFISLLVVMFVIMMGIVLASPGTAEGLDASFTSDQSRLVDPKVWVTAYGQISFSLSVCFGIMVTYSFHLKKRTDLDGTGLVVGSANSSFELLAGIGVFATLGFMTQATGKEISGVVFNGIGLALITFPIIINQAPMGALIGVLFFGSLMFAGVTSMISIVEMIVAAIQDKINIGRVSATMIAGVPMAIISAPLFSITAGLPVLGVLDKFINIYGTMVAGLVYVLAIVLLRKLPELCNHLNVLFSIRAGEVWIASVMVTAAMLGYMLCRDAVGLLKENYSGYPDSFLDIFDWGMVGAIPVLSVLLSFLSRRHGQGSNVKDEHEHEREGEE